MIARHDIRVASAYFEMLEFEQVKRGRGLPSPYVLDGTTDSRAKPQQNIYNQCLSGCREAPGVGRISLTALRP